MCTGQETKHMLDHSSENSVSSQSLIQIYRWLAKTVWQLVSPFCLDCFLLRNDLQPLLSAACGSLAACEMTICIASSNATVKQGQLLQQCLCISLHILLIARLAAIFCKLPVARHDSTVKLAHMQSTLLNLHQFCRLHKMQQHQRCTDGYQVTSQLLFVFLFQHDMTHSVCAQEQTFKKLWLLSRESGMTVP